MLNPPKTKAVAMEAIGLGTSSKVLSIPSGDAYGRDDSLLAGSYSIVPDNSGKDFCTFLTFGRILPMHYSWMELRILRLLRDVSKFLIGRSLPLSRLHAQQVILN